jgi:hypothetical protein
VEDGEENKIRKEYRVVGKHGDEHKNKEDKEGRKNQKEERDKEGRKNQKEERGRRKKENRHMNNGGQCGR